MNILLEVKDELNNMDISLTNITKVIEESTTIYPEFKTFLTIHFTGGESVNLKGWTLEKWRTFKRNAK